MDFATSVLNVGSNLETESGYIGVIYFLFILIRLFFRFVRLFTTWFLGETFIGDEPIP